MPLRPADISRAISHALRHEPWLYELELDAEGWVDLAALLAALQKRGREWAALELDDIVRALAQSSKQRHEIVGARIRARYGHSVPGRLVMQPGPPPARLYHGTSPEAAERILQVGLAPMGRQYVHLSLDTEMALAVGKRKAPTPVVIQVDAARAAADGVLFYVGNDKVWLADAVPARYLSS